MPSHTCAMGNGSSDLQSQVDDLASQVASNGGRIDALADRADTADARADETEERADVAESRADQMQADSLVDRELIAQLHADGVLSRDHVAQLEKALVSSRVIGAAVGILMVSRQATQDEALTILKQTSQRANRKLNDVAADLVDAANRREPSS